MLADDEHYKQCGIERVITIKISARIRVIRNIDVTVELVNGALGTVVSISRDISGQLKEVKIPLNATKQEHSLNRLDYKFIEMETVCVIRKQFPIRLSYGISIHSSQGLSLNNAGVEGGNMIFAPGQTYVGLSRLISRSGLHLINFDPSRINASEPAIMEYNRLR